MVDIRKLYNYLGGVVMAWTVEYNDVLQIVELTYSGRTTGEEIKEAAASRMSMGKQKGVTKFLIDTRKVEADGSATLDIYDVPDKMYPKEHVQYTNRIAILEPESSTSREMVKFYENACVNRGWLVKTFQDRESAVKWLQQRTSQQSPADDRLEAPPEE
jgi:hypothetical protein